MNFHVTYSPRPGAKIPLVFATEAKRQAFLHLHPGKAISVAAKAAPKRAVSNLLVGAA